jgi:NADH-quinone oxidoreductase subunit D
MTQLQEVTLDEIRHLVSDRAIEGDTMLLNMGPQHPSTHGVLRLLLELDGETIINCVPDIGYLHTGIEKNMESKTYQQAEVMTDRLDYLNNVGNNLAYCLAVEKIAKLDVPEKARVIRILLTELQRIASHLVWLGTQSLDLAAMSVFLYCFREREMILDIFEMVSGQRMMTTYIRPGGVWRELPDGFEEAVQKFIDYFPARIEQYDGLLTKNPLYIDRTKKIGVISADDALAWGLTGPSVRGSGVPYDLRKIQPYSGYEEFEFEVPIEFGGDVFSRYMVRMREFWQSLEIIKQALSRLKDLAGAPVRSTNRKYIPPPRSELSTSMEAVIHHFKLWTEGFSLPKGYVYFPVESPRGELGVYLESDGGPKPFRVHWRTPSFVHLQALPVLSNGLLVADLVAIIGSIDIVLGDADR